MSDESIQSKGGKAREEKLSPEQLAAIASNAAKARWAAVKTYKATHKGNFQSDFGFDVECYVLDDPNKTAVISQSGMGKAIGLSQRGNALPRLLESKSLSESVSAELRTKLAQPIKFQWGTGGAETRGTRRGWRKQMGRIAPHNTSPYAPFQPILPLQDCFSWSSRARTPSAPPFILKQREHTRTLGVTS